jgi:acyl-coenzyme A synthetase/AMP-(fatty) acid ligase
MQTIAHRLEYLYERIPDSIAIHLLSSDKPDKSISYFDLIQGSSEYAFALKKSGINPGDVVILILQHGCDLVFITTCKIVFLCFELLDICPNISIK